MVGAGGFDRAGEFNISGASKAGFFGRRGGLETEMLEMNNVLPGAKIGIVGNRARESDSLAGIFKKEILASLVRESAPATKN